MKELTVEKSIEINASATKAWEVLVVPTFLKQWDQDTYDTSVEFLETAAKKIKELAEKS